MEYIPVTCDYCHESFLRTRRRITEAKKFGWKQFCSLTCQSSSKNTQQVFQCSNPTCSSTFTRSVHESSQSEKKFCSRKCAVIVNNSLFPKRQAERHFCATCNVTIQKRGKYCSEQCAPEKTSLNREKLIQAIKGFYKENGRVPFREEFVHRSSARRCFGSWNNAIKAAGYIPNPVQFAKKYVAKDGHICDSLSEKIIDDWLSTRMVSHEVHVKYPNSQYSSDFKIGNVYVEFFGLKGQLRSYDNYMRNKLKIVKDNNITLIQLLPSDIHPISNLEKKLEIFL